MLAVAETVSIGSVLTIIAMIISALWAVSQIRATVAVLVERLTHLTSSLEKLETTVMKVDDDFQRLESRVVSLEKETIRTNQVPEIAKAVAAELQKAG